MGLHETSVSDIRKFLRSHPRWSPNFPIVDTPGGNNDLLVSVAKFIPNVVCSPEPFEGDATVLAACEAILDKMATSKQITIFAQRSKYDPGLETPLPAWYIAPAEGSTHLPRDSRTGLADNQFESPEMRTCGYRAPAEAIRQLA